MKLTKEGSIENFHSMNEKLMNHLNLIYSYYNYKNIIPTIKPLVLDFPLNNIVDNGDLIPLYFNVIFEFIGLSCDLVFLGNGSETKMTQNDFELVKLINKLREVPIHKITFDDNDLIKYSNNQRAVKLINNIMSLNKIYENIFSSIKVAIVPRNFTASEVKVYNSNSEIIFDLNAFRSDKTIKNYLHVTNGSGTQNKVETKQSLIEEKLNSISNQLEAYESSINKLDNIMDKILSRAYHSDMDESFKKNIEEKRQDKYEIRQLSNLIDKLDFINNRFNSNNDKIRDKLLLLVKVFGED